MDNASSIVNASGVPAHLHSNIDSLQQNSESSKRISRTEEEQQATQVRWQSNTSTLLTLSHANLSLYVNFCVHIYYEGILGPTRGRVERT